MKERWYASTDEERFYTTDEYSSREEAVAHYPSDGDLEPGQRFWTGLRRDVLDGIRVDGGHVIEVVRDELYEQAGDASEDWLETQSRWHPKGTVTPDQVKDLTKRLTGAFRSWLDDHGHAPQFFVVEHIESHTAPADVESDPGSQVAS